MNQLILCNDLNKNEIQYFKYLYKRGNVNSFSIDRLLIEPFVLFIEF
jgi:hypothetical protein